MSTAEERLESYTPGKEHPGGGITCGDVWGAVLLAREAIALLRQASLDMGHGECDHAHGKCWPDKVDKFLDGEP